MIKEQASDMRSLQFVSTGLPRCLQICGLIDALMVLIGGLHPRDNPGRGAIPWLGPH